MATNIPTCICGACLTCRKRASVQKWRNRNPSINTARKRKARKTPRGRELSRLYKSRWRAKEKRARSTPDQIKKSAWNAVYKAVKSGRLTRRPCEKCGNPKSQAHHVDYSKKLEVRWLCAIHHAEADGKTLP